MSAGSATIDRDIVVRRINGGHDLAVAAKADVRGGVRRRLNSVKLEIARLIVGVQNAVTTNVDITGEIDRRGYSLLQHNLGGSGHGDISGHIYLYVSSAAVDIARQRQRLIAAECD